jgi:hypothetical protein
MKEQPKSAEKKPTHAKPQLYAYYFLDLKEIAREYGYNLVVHGSMARDMDLIAIPWANERKPELDMVNALYLHMTGYTAHKDHWKTVFLYSEQPGGRHNYVLQLNRGGYHRNEKDEIEDPLKFVVDPQYYIDLSVIQTSERVSGEPPKPDLWKEVATKQKELLDQITRTFTAWKPETVQRFQDLHIMFVNASESVSGEAKTPDLSRQLVLNQMDEIQALSDFLWEIAAFLKITDIDEDTEDDELIEKIRVRLTGGSVPTPDHLRKRDESDRDWKEDFTHENGNYMNGCMYCKQMFYGHKRRVVCKICDNKDKSQLKGVPTPSDEGEPFLEPRPLLKGDPRVTINGNLVREDFRIIAESQYQRLRKASGNKFRFRLFTEEDKNQKS